MAQFNYKCMYILGIYILNVFQTQGTFSQSIKDVVNQNQCGGPLEGDVGSLTYPIPGQVVKPGQLCIWTINLKTTKAFTFSLPNLDINSSAECTDGSIRIHSLTNLVSTDKLQSYTLCNENPAPGNLFLIENVAAVIFYSGSNPGPETGFTLNWEGIAFNPIPTTNFNSYSTTPSGLIRFPVDGEYELNTIAIWLVKAGQTEEESYLDFNLTSLSLQSCLVEDPCVCDALILYEITDHGVLTESERFCGERSSAFKGRIMTNFILAFYSDSSLEDNRGDGFEVIYKPSRDDVSTTTVRPSLPCGTVIEAEVKKDGFPVHGQIMYKPDENYEANERCVWTIRSYSFRNTHRGVMKFRLEESNFEEEEDRLIVDLFAYMKNLSTIYADPHRDTLFLTNEFVGLTLEIDNANIAIITFTTKGSHGKGFMLSYEVTEVECNHSMCSPYYFSDEINSEPEGTIIETNSGMGNYMMSTYVLPPVNFEKTELQKRITFEYSWIEECSNDCCDAMWVYSFTEQTGLINVDKICGHTPAEVTFEIDDIMVFLFKGTNTGISKGYEIRWNLKN